MSHLPQESFQITFMVPLLQRRAIFSLNLNSIASMCNETKITLHSSVLIERAHYCAILTEKGRTIREGVLIEGVRYFGIDNSKVLWIHDRYRLDQQINNNNKGTLSSKNKVMQSL